MDSKTLLFSNQNSHIRTISQPIGQNLEDQDWYETHERDCIVNHEGGAGLTKVNVIKEMFRRSARWYVYYDYFVNDCDSKNKQKLLRNFNDQQKLMQKNEKN